MQKEISWSFIIAICLITIIFFAIGWVIWNEQEYDSTKTVKCYDKFSNEIIGQECKQVTPGFNIYVKLGFTAMLIVLYIYCLMLMSVLNNDLNDIGYI